MSAAGQFYGFRMRVADYTALEVLRDGAEVRIRAIGPDDKHTLVDLFSRLSPRSVYFRFFHTKQRLTEADLAQLTDVDFKREVSLAATIVEGGVAERIVGVARYAWCPGRAACAEVNFTVADQYQCRGIGKLLLKHLVAIARRNAITEIEAYVLEDNTPMLRVFRDSGFPVSEVLEDGVFHIRFNI